MHIFFIRRGGHCGSKLLAEYLLSIGIATIFEPTISSCKMLSFTEQINKMANCCVQSHSTVIFKNSVCGFQSCVKCHNKFTAFVGESGILNRVHIDNRHIIVLKRSNIVKQAISQLGLFKNHNTHISNSTKKYVNVSTLESRLKKLVRNDVGSIHFSNNPTVYYEQFQQGDARFLLNFIRENNITIQNNNTVKTTMYKSINENLKQSISNYKEIEYNFISKKKYCFLSMLRSVKPYIFKCTETIY